MIAKNIPTSHPTLLNQFDSIIDLNPENRKKYVDEPKKQSKD